MKKEHAQEVQDATVYRVQQHGPYKVFKVSKLVIDVEVEVYYVTYDEKGEQEPFCDCPGFVRQKFAKDKHKHVRVVADYVKRGRPRYADYKFRGTGANTKIRFVGQLEEDSHE